MLNHGKCSNVRPAITEKTCEEMQGRGALVCRGCPGPAAGAKHKATLEVLKLRGAADPALPSPPPSPAADAPADPIPASPVVCVDFAGHEGLLERLSSAAAERGLNLSESVVDLLYLFEAGLLVFLDDAED